MIENTTKPDEPQTIFDLDSNELELLINFRKLSKERQIEFLEHLGVE